MLERLSGLSGVSVIMEKKFYNFDIWCCMDTVTTLSYNNTQHNDTQHNNTHYLVSVC